MDAALPAIRALTRAQCTIGSNVNRGGFAKDGVVVLAGRVCREGNEAQTQYAVGNRLDYDAIIQDCDWRDDLYQDRFKSVRAQEGGERMSLKDM